MNAKAVPIGRENASIPDSNQNRESNSSLKYLNAHNLSGYSDLP